MCESEDGAYAQCIIDRDRERSQTCKPTRKFCFVKILN